MSQSPTQSPAKSSVPRLDLAPKLNRPLSLGNPIDYLRLLYWVFFFPQALRWYEERYCARAKESNERALWHQLRYDPVARALVIQAALLLLLVNAVGGGLLQSLGLEVKWVVVAGVVAFVVAGAVAGAVAGVVAGVVAFGLAFGVAFSVALVVASSVAFDVAFGLAFGVAFSVALVVASSVAVGLAGGVAVGVAVGLMLGEVFGAVFGVVFGVGFGLAVGVAVGVTFGVITMRSIEWLICSFVGFDGAIGQAVGRLVWLPLPRVRQQLTHWLTEDWAAGVYNSNQFLAYSLQFLAVVDAVQRVLARKEPRVLLPAVATLADDPFDWALLRFGSADLHNAMRNQFLPELSHFPDNLRTDSAARAACAGFWFWHREEAAEAEAAFAHVRALPHGEELYQIAAALVSALEATDLSAIGQWQAAQTQLAALEKPWLRAATLQTLAVLRQVSAAASTASHAHSLLNRSAALGRANAELTTLIETGHTFCPQPEWNLIRQIAQQWLPILSKAGGQIGEAVLRQPVVNPYEGYSGQPVVGASFSGRQAIFEQIERLWASNHTLPVLVVYGHRRMGKSSILRNLPAHAPPGTLLVYLDMQNATLVDHSADFLFEITDSIYQQAVKAGFAGGAPPQPADSATLNSARRSLNTLLRQLDSQMQGKRLILAIDEFELIEDAINAGKIEGQVLAYLRAINQEFPWLALVFAGLHTLHEMGSHYQDPFLAQTEHVAVRYLSQAEALRLITQPDPDFALEYSPALLAELYRLSGGQPYLLQRLCWELVNRWNERFMAAGEATPRQLEITDLDGVLNSDFFLGAAYYFDGVWDNVSPAERRVMQTLASKPEQAWSVQTLAQALAVSEAQMRGTLAALRNHDVIPQDENDLRFASELLRRWIEVHHTLIPIK